jgi:hypothetical protein
MKAIFLIPVLLFTTLAFGQKSFNDYAQFYPIGDDPNIRFMTSYTKQETILFEANPIVRFSVYNNFLKSLMDEHQAHTQAWYVSFRPQLRMYTNNSRPVRTPSYKIFLGTQHLFRIASPNKATCQFWGFSAESGHYSNGQDRSAFSELYADGSRQSDSIYNLITASTDLAQILNRQSGNFSTNLTEVIVNYRTYKLDDDNLPKQLHSIQLGYMLYHNRFLGIANFGGFTQNDIKIYGRHRLLLEYEFMKVLEQFNNTRFSINQNFELIQKPHKSVNTVRAETVFTWYPFAKSKALGFCASYIYGHDNYNYRFVDSGHQVTLGITWSQFPPINLSSKLPF